MAHVKNEDIMSKLNLIADATVSLAERVAMIEDRGISEEEHRELMGETAPKRAEEKPRFPRVLKEIKLEHGTIRVRGGSSLGGRPSGRSARRA